MHTVLALSGGFGYAVAALLVKQAESRGLGTMRNLFISNVLMGIVVCGFCLTHSMTFDWERIHLPLITGFTFFLGQLTTFLSIRLGDVSVTTPILGAKALFVALLSVFVFGVGVPWTIWVGAALSFVGIGFLSYKGKRTSKSPLPCVLVALASAAFFAVTDSGVSWWADEAGRYGFLFIMFASLAVSSVVIIPFFRAPLREVPKAALAYGVTGNILLAVQALVMAIALSTYQIPATTNILYSSRGLWSLLLVVTIGPMLGSNEHEQSRLTLFLRALGALLMMLSIGFVFL